MIRSTAWILSIVTLATAAGCMTPPQNLNTSLNRSSAQGRFVVALQPPEKPAAINQLHSWQIKVASDDGAPISKATITVAGGMPQHGHGLPTRPQVTRELADGTYLLEGMKFSMTGWWEIRLAIRAPQGSDDVTFNTIVAPPGASR